MRWIEVCVETCSEDIDTLCIELQELGAEAFVIEDEADFKSFLEHNHQYWDYVDEDLEQKFAGVSRVKFYLTDDGDGKAVLSAVQERFAQKVHISFVEDSDWENNWREYYKPIPVGEKLLVVPEWEKADDIGRIPLRLDPGLIFGTGSHATTRMCLTLLEKFAAPGRKVLDLGCGSGILGIGALQLGADSVVGCDIDPKAPDVAEANAALNGIGTDRFKIYAGDILSDAGLVKNIGTGYDIVLANIVSDVIIPLCPSAMRFMAPNGVFICSGIIEGRQEEVIRALDSAGFAVTQHLAMEDWHCFAAVKK